MSKHKRNRGKRRQAKRRQSSMLKDHRQHKKVLTPPFLQIPNLKPVSWQHDGLPDFLWIQAVREETGDLAAANKALDVLDKFVPEPPDASEDENGGERPEPEEAYEPHPNVHLDGRISTFPLVPEDRRAEAREAMTKAAPWALPDGLGHALALYPECPAAWLYEDWAKVNHADPEVGTNYLKRLVAPLLDPKDRPSSQVRTIPVARAFKHEKIVLQRGMEVIDLLPKYPTGLNEEEQLHVEQWNRNMWNVHQMTSDRTIANAWVTHFWKQNWRISACTPEPNVPLPLAEADAGEDPPSEEGRGHRQPTVAETQRGFVEAIDALGRELRAAQQRVDIDVYRPTPDEVKLGLASRMFRLLRHVASDPDLWTNEMGPHALRPMIDARITIAWLLKQNDPELFQKFKDNGVGKRKLFKLQLEELMDNEDLTSDENDQALHERLEAEVNQDVMEEFIKIDLGGSFSGKNIRQMAQEADLGELYSLSYQPLSTEAHGEWGSLMALDLRHCGNPLHRYHRLGTFDTSPTVTVHLGWVRTAFTLARDAINDCFASYGLDVSPLFERCLAQMDEARTTQGPD
jgi:Family of unknown function (DUF5677)